MQWICGFEVADIMYTTNVSILSQRGGGTKFMGGVEMIKLLLWPFYLIIWLVKIPLKAIWWILVMLGLAAESFRF